MEAGRKLFIAAWRSPVGAAALYASLATHLALALWSLFQRRQLRIPLWEGAQLMLGLAIPTLLITHAIGTHLASGLYGVIDSYTRMMLVFWARPELGIRQVLLLLVAWTHGCIGLHFWLRLKPWYGRVSPVLAALALLVPLLALLGFLEAMREITELARSAAWLKETLGAVNELGAGQRTELGRISDGALLAFGGAVAVTLVARRLRNFHEQRYKSIRVTYPDGRRIVAPIGYSVLEISRHAGIPHASVCGGRGRCSTCRVRVSAGLTQLPPASAEEKRVLDRVGAAPNVRLACQTRPSHRCAVTPLLPAAATPSEARSRPGYVQGREEEIAILFADLRSFTQFAEHRLPYDVVFLLNRYFRAMGTAVEASGGQVDKFIGDGVMALFGVGSRPSEGCRQALAAARRMSESLRDLNQSLAGDVADPLRIGIGIHAGPAIVGEMGHGRATSVTAVGDTVNTASRLETLTKEYQCQ